VPSFIPVPLLAKQDAPVEREIKVEVRKGSLVMTVTWPMSAASDFAHWSAILKVIRIDCAWLAVQPLDMRAGTDTALGRVVQVFGAAHPHHAYLFANRRANRVKVLVHDGIGIWLAARRLNEGKFVWPATTTSTDISNSAWNNCKPWCWVCPGSAWAITASSR
jgi:transposase